MFALVLRPDCGAQSVVNWRGSLRSVLGEVFCGGELSGEDALLVCANHSRRLVPVSPPPDEFLGRARHEADSRPGLGNLDGVVD